LSTTAIAKSLKKIFEKVCNNHNISDLTHKSTDFTRRYKLSFDSVVLKILHSFQDSVEYNLSTFLPKLNIPIVTGAAFSYARYKLKIDLFQDLNQEMFNLIDTLPKKLWNGYRLVAGDGTTVNLPVHKSTIEHFGVFRESKTGGKTVHASAAMLYDVLSNFILSAEITPFKIGEKTIMSSLIKESNLSNTIMLFDRGFCTFSFFKELINNKLDFCIRLKTSESLFANKILNHESDDFIIDWIPSEAECSTAKKKGIDPKPITVRATKITLPSGEIEVLISSLLDMDKFSKSDISELYQLRWGIEEGYKKLKPKMKLEQFGCKKQEGIYQEFYSHIFMMNLTQILCNQAQSNIEQKTIKRKHTYKYNWINAYKFIKNSFIELFTNADIETIIGLLLKQIERSIIAIIEDRSFIRTIGGGRKNRHSPEYK
jgi:hypothetical protein